MFFHIVIAFLVISSFQTEAVKIILRRPNSKISGNDNRIIGGQQISIEEAPWQVAIQEKGELVCGGSVISELNILTAAHCVYGYKATDFTIRAGSSYYNKGGQLRRVRKIYIDGRYNHRTSNNDVAVMKLSTPLQFNQKVIPVKLATDYWPESGSAVVSGWGLIRESAKRSLKILREVTVQFLSLEKCRQAYKKKNIAITGNMVCAGATNGGKDACQGDSGGPLVENGTQYGIVSMGIGCGRPNFPGVYTSVARKLSWIETAWAKN